MVRINKIYTRTGDDGKTWVVGKERVSKTSKQICAIGDVDELNAWIGKVRTIACKLSKNVISPILEDIQQTLFDIGAVLACAEGESHPSIQPIDPNSPKELEDTIDKLTENLPELRSFVLPGGDELLDALHIARTICRRAERTILDYSVESSVDSNIKIYLNRLSDLLFAMARWEADGSKIKELLWIPLAQRKVEKK